MYKVTKTFGHHLGLSAAFRQHRADSHCNKLHGYALQVEVTFACADNSLNEQNWCVDFGSLKSFKQILETNFDHKTIVAQDDPEISWFEEAHKRKIIDLVIMDKVGCEAFAFYIYHAAGGWLISNGYSPRVWVYEIKVSEHSANSASFKPSVNSKEIIRNPNG